MTRAIAVLVVVCALLLGLRLVYRPHRQPPRPALSTPGNSDYYMNDATAYQMDKQGRLVYRTRVAQTLHFPDGSTRFKRIDVHYFKGTKTYWALRAARARIPPNTRGVYLYDGVRVRHPRPGGPVVRATTAHAWVWWARGRVVSRAPVAATEPGQSLAGRGLRIDLDNDRLRLLNHVHATYQP